MVDQGLADFTIRGRMAGIRVSIKALILNSQNCKVNAGKPEPAKRIEIFQQKKIYKQF